MNKKILLTALIYVLACFACASGDLWHGVDWSLSFHQNTVHFPIAYVNQSINTINAHAKFGAAFTTCTSTNFPEYYLYLNVTSSVCNGSNVLNGIYNLRPIVEIPSHVNPTGLNQYTMSCGANSAPTTVCIGSFCHIDTILLCCVNESAYNVSIGTEIHELGFVETQDFGATAVNQTVLDRNLDYAYLPRNWGIAGFGAVITDLWRVGDDYATTESCVSTTTTTTTTASTSSTSSTMSYPSTTTTTLTNWINKYCFNVTDENTKAPITGETVALFWTDEYGELWSQEKDANSSGIAVFEGLSPFFRYGVSAYGNGLYQDFTYFEDTMGSDISFPPCRNLPMHPLTSANISNYTTYAINGNVIDYGSLSGIGGARIIVSGCVNRNNIYSDSNGKYNITGLSPSANACNIRATASNHADTGTYQIYISDKNMDLNIYMSSINHTIIPTTTNPNRPTVDVGFYFYETGITGLRSGVDNVHVTLSCGGYGLKAIYTKNGGQGAFSDIDVGASCVYSYDKDKYVGRSGISKDDLYVTEEVNIIRNQDYACSITGTLKYSNGTKITANDVLIMDAQGSQFATLPSDSNGYYSQAVKCGQTYAISTVIDGKTLIKRVTLEASEDDTKDASFTVQISAQTPASGLAGQVIAFLMSLVSIILMIVLLVIVLVIVLVMKLIQKAAE